MRTLILLLLFSSQMELQENGRCLWPEFGSVGQWLAVPVEAGAPRPPRQAPVPVLLAHLGRGTLITYLLPSPCDFKW